MLPRCRLLLLAAVLLAVAACTRGGDEPTPADDAASVPDGWTVVEGAGFSLAHPPDWTAEPGETVATDDGREVARVVDLVGPGGELDTRVQVRSGTAVPNVSAEESLRLSLAAQRFQLDAIERETEIRSWEPAGAEDAARIRLSYDQELQGETLRIGEIAAFATGQGIDLKLRAVDREDRFDDVVDTVNQIMATVTLTGEAPPSAELEAASAP